LITIAIFSYYAIRPTVTTILSLQKSIDEQNQILNTVKEKVKNLAEGKQNYDNIPDSVENKLKNMVPDNPALSHLINSLVYFAEDSEASLSGLQFQPVELENQKTELSKNAEVKEIEFTVNLQGDFPQLMKALGTLKRLDRLVSISAVNFTQPLDNPLIMSITGKAYYMKN
jgi:hypothetical protein